MDRGAWWVAVHGITESNMTERLTLSLSLWDLTRRWISSYESTCNAGGADLIPESERSSGEENDSPLQYFAWEIPWTEEPVGLQSMGSQTWKRCATSVVIM